MKRYIDNSKTNPNLVVRSFLVALVTACSCGTDEAATEAPTAELSVENGTMHFYDEELGVSHTDAFVLSNTGDAPLTIEDMVLEAPEDAFGVDLPVLPFTLGPRQSRTIEVTFTPVDCWSGEGELVIWSELNDPTTVYFRPKAIVSDVFLEPSLLDFERLTVGESRTLALTIINPGGCVLEIDEMALVGTSDIRFARIDDPGTEVQEYTDVPIGMVDDKRFEVDIVYSPTEAALGFSVLYVLTNHPREDFVRATIVGNAVQAE